MIINFILDNFKVSTSNQDIVTNIPVSPAPQQVNVSNFVKAGTIAVTSDNDQTFTFDTPFTGNASDIIVTTTITESGANSEMAVVATTLTGFTVNRNDALSGTVNCNYIAVNTGETLIPTEDI